MVHNCVQTKEKNGQFVDHTMLLSHFIPHPNSYPVDMRDTYIDNPLI